MVSRIINEGFWYFYLLNNSQRPDIISLNNQYVDLMDKKMIDNINLTGKIQEQFFYWNFAAMSNWTLKCKRTCV